MNTRFSISYARRVLTTLHRGAPGSAPVVVFPHAGGSPRFFLHWGQVLPATTLIGVTYPGRDARAEQTYADCPHGSDLVGLARSAAESIERARLTAPVLVGHSFGAYIAYETAAVLTRNGAQGVRLVVSGQNPPEHRAMTTLHRADDAELIADMVRQNRRSAAVWEDDNLRAIFLPAAREDYRLLETYVPTMSAVAEILVCYGDRDPEVSSVKAAGWHRYAARAHPPAVLAGGHFYLQAPDRQLPRRLAASFGLR